ncbi:MAG: recombination-associated protein RdgC [Gammaproteobacteria bacterium]|nr:recombination-associated protein RdgC [Gammaproteobacteria bacterium]
MCFKNIQLFELVKPISFTPKVLSTELEKVAFTSCVATLPSSSSWISPSEEEFSSLVCTANSYMMICLQDEDKILPTTVLKKSKLLKKLGFSTLNTPIQKRSLKNKQDNI